VDGNTDGGHGDEHARLEERQARVHEQRVREADHGDEHAHVVRSAR
jgi:hypothetical protein